MALPRLIVPLLLAALGTSFASAQDFASYSEPDFPFVTSTVNAREAGAPFPSDNLTVRGVIVKLGDGTHALFDTDLLRLSAAWDGGFITMTGIATKSYQRHNNKAGGGQGDLPKPVGDMIFANGVYPGWSAGEPVTRDPRKPAPDPNEVGRGPIEPSQAKWRGLKLEGDGVVLEYSVGGTDVEERLAKRDADQGLPVITRRLEIAPHKQDFYLALFKVDGDGWTYSSGPNDGGFYKEEAVFAARAEGADTILFEKDNILFLKIPASAGRQSVVVSQYNGPRGRLSSALSEPAEPTSSRGAEPTTRWEQVLTTKGTVADPVKPYVVDSIPLPLNNHWRRNIRLSGITFFENGTAAVVSIEGDVWLIDGLNHSLAEVKWKRYASGLHEPQNLVVRDGKLFVFTRNGIVRLHDTNGDGEADVYENFSNVFAQTGETREFPADIVLRRDGGFYLAKGGQQISSRGKHNGGVLAVSPDGQSYELLANGLRQPFLGFNSETGLLTASDQQGNWVPTTPVRIIPTDRYTYHGFRQSAPPGEEPEVMAPPVWIPHAVCHSSIGQVWANGQRFGELNGGMIQLDYYAPGALRVFLDMDNPTPQGASLLLDLKFDTPLLKGAMNPADGQLYVVGFQIWGTQSETVSALERVRYTGLPSALPMDAVSFKEGLLLKFNVPIDPESVKAENFAVQRWNYKRTGSYGSGHYKPDGSSGQEPVGVGAARLGADGKSVFVSIPDMKPVMQMQLDYKLRSPAVGEVEDAVYFTVHELREFDAGAHGFDPAILEAIGEPAVTVAASAPDITPSVENGRLVYEKMGCFACHSLDGSTEGKTGPSWKGLSGLVRQLANGGTATVDAAYLRESILAPTAKVPVGYDQSDIGMPSYKGILTPGQIDSLVLFIQSLEP